MMTLRKTLVIKVALCLAMLWLPAFGQGTRYSGDLARKPKPAFPGQTDAPAPSKTVAAGQRGNITARLTSPWSMALLPDGNFLVTESIGSMRIVRPDGVVSAPLTGVPGVKVVAAQGLHDVLLDPGFAQNRLLYFCYFAPPRGEEPAMWPKEFFYQKVWTKSLAERRTMQIGTERVARARLSKDNKSLEDVETLVEGAERRIVLAPDGTLLDHRRGPVPASTIRNTTAWNTILPTIPISAVIFRGACSGSIGMARFRKTIRGSAAPPCCRRRLRTGCAIRKARQSIPPRESLGNRSWSAGRRRDRHRSGGKKLRLARRLLRRAIRFSTDRRAEKRAGGKRTTSMPGVEEPAYFWVPDIAPSGMLFYTGDRFPEWKGKLFVGALEGQALVRLVLNGDRVVAEERLLTDRKMRVRDIRQGPDGNYLPALERGAGAAVTEVGLCAQCAAAPVHEGASLAGNDSSPASSTSSSTSSSLSSGSGVLSVLSGSFYLLFIPLAYSYLWLIHTSTLLIP